MRRVVLIAAFMLALAAPAASVAQAPAPKVLDWESGENKSYLIPALEIPAFIGALNAVDHARYALVQSFARVFLLMLPFAWFLREAWGADAIYAAELVANLGGGVLAGLIVWRVLRSDPVPTPVTVR